MRKAFPKGFRADVVQVALRRDADVSIAQVVADFGISASCLQRWLGEEAKKSALSGRAAAVESAEPCGDGCRIRLLEQENEVLRRAAAYLSQAHLPGK